MPVTRTRDPSLHCLHYIPTSADSQCWTYAARQFQTTPLSSKLQGMKPIDMDRMLKAVGGRIGEYRKARGCTQEQLAEYAEISVNYLATIEIGKKTPSLRTLARLAKALGVAVSDLLAEGEAKEELDVTQYISRSLGSLENADAEFTKALLQFVVDYLKHKPGTGKRSG